VNDAARFHAEVMAQQQMEDEMQDERFAALSADMVKAKRALGNVTKNKKANAGSHSYAYSDLAAVTATIDSAIAESEAALWFTQNVTTEADSVTVVSMVFHANGAKYDGAPMTLPVLKRDPQGFGSAISYCRRYSALAFWGIAAEDDDGKAAGDGPQKGQEPRQEPLDASEGKLILDSLREAAMDGIDALNARLKKIPDSPTKTAVWSRHRASLMTTAEKAPA
jgi:hypothetical protein